jgi:2,4-dienoyl-CoA reductase-like NADH-dependent reductase (Old Yellow Enzyme family)
MEDWDIARVIADYADAAERMAEAGLDGIELECYGHLMDQFMSPLTNELDGPYGGSLENRARFALDVVAAIREKGSEKSCSSASATPPTKPQRAGSTRKKALPSATCSRRRARSIFSMSSAARSTPIRR